LAIIGGALIGFGDPLIKYGMVLAGINQFIFTSIDDWMRLLVPPFLIGIIIATIGTLTFITSLSMDKASILNPITGGTTYITIVILSRILLAEYITWQKILGMTIIVVGLFFLSMMASGSKEYQIPEKETKEVS